MLNALQIPINQSVGLKGILITQKQNRQNFGNNRTEERQSEFNENTGKAENL
jgi:hypothetical protein